MQHWVFILEVEHDDILLFYFILFHFYITFPGFSFLFFFIISFHYIVSFYSILHTKNAYEEWALYEGNFKDIIATQ